MRVKKLIVAATVAGTAVLSACGTGASAAGGPTVPALPASSDTPSTTADPTTTPPAPPPAPATTTTTKTTPKPTTSKPKPKPAPPPAPAGGTPCTITDGACIDLSANRSWLLSGGKVTYGPVAITSGRPGFRTPPGLFHVQYKDIDHKSRAFNNAPMPYSVFFYNGMAFHSGSLTVQSHGCIHLSTAAAKTYFNTLKVGDAVQVVP
ncbi:MAG TPA: L,D-transpeptidase [Actinophytocola sp.]|jgi:lipoprotein-anchoring transpeptidase ErfK/SrfK|uniref:L,D-transpeptidase n=1 Tax=Actinophytocola sp. TaxID=1872138 RepID=UPI002DFF4B42|nr:L,D-transpeptidase [Actinophytocola sp.]